MIELLYLGNIIGQDGVKVDMEKIRSILEWPRPKSITGLRGFSHLTSPLTDLTKKYAFHWHEGTNKYFQIMKEVISNCPILALRDFSKPFVLECEASGEGISAVLKQGQHPIDFESRKLQKHDRIYYR